MVEKKAQQAVFVVNGVESVASYTDGDTLESVTETVLGTLKQPSTDFSNWIIKSSTGVELPQETKVKSAERYYVYPRKQEYASETKMVDLPKEGTHTEDVKTTR